jgi:hypothetical protein
MESAIADNLVSLVTLLAVPLFGLQLLIALTEDPWDGTLATRTPRRDPEDTTRARRKQMPLVICHSNGCFVVDQYGKIWHRGRR